MVCPTCDREPNKTLHGVWRYIISIRMHASRAILLRWCTYELCHCNTYASPARCAISSLTARHMARVSCSQAHTHIQTHTDTHTHTHTFFALPHVYTYAYFRFLSCFVCNNWCLEELWHILMARVPTSSLDEDTPLPITLPIAHPASCTGKEAGEQYVWT